MKIERLLEYVTEILVISLGLAFAVFSGQVAGRGQTDFFVFIAALVFCILCCIRIHTNVWIVLPVCWPLYGRISALPIPFSVRELVVMAAFGTFIILKTFKVFRSKPKLNWLDILVILNLIYLIITYVRNPTGVDAFNSDRVGGKPYFFVAISTMAYWILIHMRATPKQAWRMPIMTFGVVCVITVLSLITKIFPATCPYIAPLYSAIDPTSYISGLAGTGTDTVNVHGYECFREFSRYGMVVLCSYFPPLTLLLPFYFWRFLAFVICLCSVFAAGYRSSTILAAMIYGLGTYIRGSWRQTVVACFVGACFILCLILGQGMLYELPLPAQRALSYLPGDWNYKAKEDGESSTAWRVFMWKEVLASNKYIEDKIFGDGYGMTRFQFEAIQAHNASAQPTSEEAGQEVAMLAGDYHSGPLSMVHTIGCVGGALFYLLMIGMTIESLRLIGKAKGTDYLPWALFIGMPLIAEPVYYTFVFGGFDNAFGMAVFNAGLLRLLDRSMEAPVSQPAPKEPEQSLWLDPKFPGRANFPHGVFPKK